MSERDYIIMSDETVEARERKRKKARARAMAEMGECELRTGASCFLVKDERLKGNWYKTPIYDFLEEEGFVSWKNASFPEDIDWLYINIYSKVYSKGRVGIALTKVVGDHAITFDEFLTIYNIYKKYEDFDVLKMNQQEQDKFDANFPEHKMKKIIGCKELTHEAVQEYISSGWWGREMLPWEHCGMEFSKVCVPMHRSFLTSDIHHCIYHGKSYYFGIGLDEPTVTDDMLENAEWFVYTWSD